MSDLNETIETERERESIRGNCILAKKNRSKYTDTNIHAKKG